MLVDDAPVPSNMSTMPTVVKIVRVADVDECNDGDVSRAAVVLVGTAALPSVPFVVLATVDDDPDVSAGILLATEGVLVLVGLTMFVADARVVAAIVVTIVVFISPIMVFEVVVTEADTVGVIVVVDDAVVAQVAV